MQEAHLKITGKVQGVFYRAYAQEKANSLGLKGYAYNMDDGSVEALVQGEEAEIQSFIDWAKQGSPSSKVENVEVNWRPPGEIYKDFSTY